MRLLKNINSIRAYSSTIIEAVDGTEPYAYSIEANGAGGSIDSVTGLYVAPEYLDSDPRKRIDTITVTDDLGATLSIDINILSVEEIVADIIATGLNLPNGQVVIQNQKFKVPNDEKVYVSVTLIDGKPYSNNKTYGNDVTGFYSLQKMNIRDMVNINIVSSSISVMSKRHDLVMALNSDYSNNMQTQNGIKLSKIPLSIVNLSEIEGARIPYGFNITVALQYGISKKSYVEYFDNFSQPQITI